MNEHRTEKDSMGEVKVPSDALYGAQTQRARDNFRISGLRFPREFVRALGLIKQAAAGANAELGLLGGDVAGAIENAAGQVAGGEHDEHFPLDVFQTGSGTSTNMNANEVIATLAGRGLGRDVHPNDHVNMCQSSNDVIPSAIHVSAALSLHEQLLPALGHLGGTLKNRASELKDTTKTGRTHLMDAMPVTFGQELGGWAAQVEASARSLESLMPGLCELALGGTAVGTGINAHPEFGRASATRIAEQAGLPFKEAENHFAAQASMDTAVELSGRLRRTAVALSRIANDLRWMNSGPIAGLAEITLPALQPGSSIMPGKINPVAPEAAMMACAQVMGNDAAVAIAGASSTGQLNVMLPLIAHNLLSSIRLLSNSARMLADSAVSGFSVNTAHISALLERNPVLATALNPIIGYDRAAEVARTAYEQCRPVLEVAAELTGMSPEELKNILNPEALAKGGIRGRKDAK